MTPAPAPAPDRYARQRILPGFGDDGQRALESARVLVVGAGGLGSIVIPSLAAAGVGTIGIVDNDTVESSNLHRQLIHAEADVGSAKSSSAAGRVAALNTAVVVREHHDRLDRGNALAMFDGYDLVIDGSDNFATRYLTNDAAALCGIPLVWGAVSQFGGQAGLAWAERGPHYRDLFPAPPPPGFMLSCAEGGVFPTTVAVIGAIMATEALKVLAGIGEPLIGRVTTFDALTGSFRELSYERDPSGSPITELIDYDEFCGVGSTGTAIGPGTTVSAPELAALLQLTGHPPTGHTPTGYTSAGHPSAGLTPTAGTPAVGETVLLDVREPWEAAVATLPGALLIPLGELLSELAGERASERAGGIHRLDRQGHIVVYCHHGVRSAHALSSLREHGFSNARHLGGGIDAWARLVDQTMDRY